MLHVWILLKFKHVFSFFSSNLANYDNILDLGMIFLKQLIELNKKIGELFGWFGSCKLT